MCLQSFWYKAALLEHLKTIHSVADPDKYEREEREKRLRRMREEQQRILAAKRARMSSVRGRGGGMMGRTTPLAGPRPSFQYRDGSFICDLCKKSFSDGNDMVSHWKQHVKRQRQEEILRQQRRQSYLMTRPRSGTRGRGRGAARGRPEKGKPRWTAYLVWSTRRRKQLMRDNPDWTFAEVAKEIGAEWRRVAEDKRDRLQDEAEQLNLTGQRKLPEFRSSDESSDSDDSDSDDSDTTDSSDTDPDFEENLQRPVMVKVKNEKGEEIEVPASTQRSNRQRKRPSFFQEFENEENNLDKILDEFEQEQLEESRKPRPERKPRPSGEGIVRRRRRRSPSPKGNEEQVEMETSRSGRVRKKPKFRFEGDGESGSTQDETDDDFKPDDTENTEEPDEEFNDDTDEAKKELEADKENVNRNRAQQRAALIAQQRGRRRKIMTEEEIEEATKAAIEYKKAKDKAREEAKQKKLAAEAAAVKVEASAASAEGDSENANPGGLDGEVTEEPTEKQQNPDEVVDEDPNASTSKNEESKIDNVDDAEKSDKPKTQIVYDTGNNEVDEGGVTGEQNTGIPSGEQQPQESVSGGVVDDDPEDLLASTRLEESDDKFKDLMAESQMENMFD